MHINVSFTSYENTITVTLIICSDRDNNQMLAYTVMLGVDSYIMLTMSIYI